MVIANLFKYKVHFHLVGHDGDQYEPHLYSKGYHYVSNEIENGESIGFRSTHDLYGREMKPLFRYILSNITREMEEENLYRISIKTHLIRGEDHEDYVIVAENFEDDFSLETCEGVFYTHPRNLLNDKFSIYVESYAYIVPRRIREEYLRPTLNAAMEEMNDAIIPPDETYKQECCVICLESAPNILYLFYLFPF